MLRLKYKRMVSGIIVCLVVTAVMQALAGESIVKDWIVLGDFPNPEKTVASQTCPRVGFDLDYLSDFGGEAKAVLTENSTVKIRDAAGKEREIRACKAKASPAGLVNFAALFPDSNAKAAYAAAIIRSDREEEVFIEFGSDDSAKVWCNGSLVHQAEVKFRATKRGDGLFSVKLRPGDNHLLVKVENGTGGWSFAMAIMDKTTVLHRKLCRELRDCNIYPKLGQSYVFSGSTFPEIVWNASDAVIKAMGTTMPVVRWFDSKGQQVKSPDKPGRYIVYSEMKTHDGLVWRRAATFCKAPSTLRKGWGISPDVNVGVLNKAGIDQDNWKRHQAAINVAAGDVLTGGIFATENGASLLAYALQMRKTDHPDSTIDNPWISNAEAHLSIKRHLLGIAPDKFKTLQSPIKLDHPAPVLRSGSPEEAGIKPDSIARLRQVCNAWASDGGMPFVVTLARNGIIYFHESFGNTTLDQKFEIASITKAASGMLFAQFIDQGIMSPDDPVGKYLPDFPVTGEKVLTLRHCLTHTSGLAGHFDLGGILNPWLDNVIANEFDLRTPGRTFNYNGMGFDLAGNAMEMTSGKSVLRMFQENLFLPLGINDVYQWDMAGRTRARAYDVARLGQLLLNRGSYGNLRFFSPQALEQVMPQQLSKYYPGVKSVYGFGLCYLLTKDPASEKKGIPERNILGNNVIGHGAASSSVFRVDFDHNLVIAVTRDAPGNNYYRHLAEFLLSIEAGLK